MVGWIRLTKGGGSKIDVNMDQVAYIGIAPGGATEIMFSGGVTVSVYESRDEIRQLMEGGTTARLQANEMREASPAAG
jgi:hypothetical protein